MTSIFLLDYLTPDSLGSNSFEQFLVLPAGYLSFVSNLRRNKMSLQTIVKISNVTNLSDARYCAGMGVEMLGFSLDTFPVEKFNEIKNWIAGVKIVGETNSTDLAHITQLVQSYQLDYLQVSSQNLIDGVLLLGLPVIICLDFFELSESEILAIAEQYKQQVAYFLLENSDEFAHLENETLDALNRLAINYRILLGFGLKESNIREVLNEVPLAGIALMGEAELRPGYKDFGEMMNILEAIEED